MSGFKMDDYVDVAERIHQFKELYPDGVLQTIDFGTLEVGGQTFIWVKAAAHRQAEDTRPGVGTAWEPVPGKTPYTRDSELMNAETSAWGRAIVALGIPTKKIASAEEVRNRQAERQPEPKPAKPTPIRPEAQPGEPSTPQQHKQLGITWGRLLKQGISEDELRSWLPGDKKSRRELTIDEAHDLIQHSRKMLAELTGGAT